MGLRRQYAKVLRLLALRRKDDLAEEISIHLAMEEQENLDAGVPEAKARYAALRKFGNVTAASEKSRGMWGWSCIEQCAQDLRYSLFGLRRNPLFAFSAVGMLTLGITAAIVVFSIVDAVLLRRSSFVNPDSVAQIQQWHNDRGWSPIAPWFMIWCGNGATYFRR